MFDSGVHGCNFFDHVDFILRKIPDPTQVLQSQSSLSLAQEPSWGFLDEEETDEHESCRDNLNCEWDDPLRVAWFHSGRNSIL